MAQYVILKRVFLKQQGMLVCKTQLHLKRKCPSQDKIQNSQCAMLCKHRTLIAQTCAITAETSLQGKIQRTTADVIRKAAIANQVQACSEILYVLISAAAGSECTATALKLHVPGFFCVYVLPLPSFLSLFRPVRSVRLPAEHAAAKYTHISKHSKTTDRQGALRGQRCAGNRSKGEIRERQRGVYTGNKRKIGRAIENPGHGEVEWQHAGESVSDPEEGGKREKCESTLICDH